MPRCWITAAAVMARSIRRRRSAGETCFASTVWRAKRIRPARAAIEVAGFGTLGRHALLERRAHVRVLDFRKLRPQRRLVEGRELSELGDELVDAVAQRAGRQRVAVGLDPRDLRRRDLVVDRVAQGLEVGSLVLDGGRQIAGLPDAPLVVAHEEAPLELVGQQVVARLVEALEGQVALEEARRVPRLVLGAGEAAVGAHLRELVVGVGLDEELLEHVAAHEVVVVGELVPQRRGRGRRGSRCTCPGRRGPAPRAARKAAQKRSRPPQGVTMRPSAFITGSFSPLLQTQ